MKKDRSLIKKKVSAKIKALEKQYGKCISYCMGIALFEKGHAEFVG